MSRYLSANFLLAVLLALSCASSSQAAITFVANLTTGQEPTLNGPTRSGDGSVRPTPFGFATFVLNDLGTELTMEVTVFNLDITTNQTPGDTNDNLTAAHIHVGAIGATTATFPVRWGFFGLPDNDNNPDNLVITPFANGVGGTFRSVWDAPEGNAGTTLASNLPAIRAGFSYLNFHTVQNPGGEIRGVILETPEPASLTIWGLTALSLAAASQYRRRRLAG